MKIAVVNGPNLNWLGRRETKIYGKQSWSEIWEMLQNSASPRDIQLTYFQSNHEGALIDFLQQNDDQCDGVVFNPAGYTHTSVALRDCVAALSVPVIEVHLSKINRREDFRKISLLSDVVFATISGLGSQGYLLAMHTLANSLKI